MTDEFPEPGSPKTLFIVDLSGYVFRAYHAVPPLSNAAGLPTNAIYGVTVMLQRLVQEWKPSLLAVALDSKSPSFRAEIYDQYKAHRPPAPPDLSVQIGRIRDVVDAYAIPCFQREGIEADDLIATAVKEARSHGLTVVIVSADKDLLQLVGDQVWMLDTMRQRIFGPAETKEKMGVMPNQVRDLLALMGDASDNVPGVPSVGPKTAAQLIEEFGSVDGVYANIESIKKKNLKEKLVAHKADAYLSLDLVTLRDSLDIHFDLEALKYGGAHKDKLRALFTEFEFTKLLLEVGGAPPPTVTRTVTTANSLEDISAFAARAKAVERFAFHLIHDGDERNPDSIVGVGLSADENEALYVASGHRTLGAPTQFHANEILSILRPLFESSTILKCAHDSKISRLVLRAFGVDLYGPLFDAMLASYLINPERGDHTIEEVSREVLTLEIPSAFEAGAKGKALAVAMSELSPERVANRAAFAASAVFSLATKMSADMERVGVRTLYDEIELPLAAVLADVERAGVLLDAHHIAELSKRVDHDLVAIERKCREIVGHEIALNSPRQLETVLFDELHLRVVKKTKTARSTDHEVLEELAAEHPLPEAILEHRMLAKLKSTYLDMLPRECGKDGRIRTRFNQAVAATGRLSSNDPNLQNIPIRTEIGRSIRDAFIAPQGFEILSADYSQIELRVLAHLSGDAELVEAFTINEDVHVRTARALFGVPTEGVTREMRGRAKTVNFAVIYGQTEFALARNLKIDRKEAGRYIAAFFERYAGVARYLDEVVTDARKSGVVHTLFGRRRLVNDLNSSNFNLRMAAERVARNTPIQGTSADILKIAMVRIAAKLRDEKFRARMLLTVHDELVFEAPTEEKSALETMVRDSMQHAANLKVPLLVEAGWGPSWGKAH